MSPRLLTRAKIKDLQSAKDELIRKEKSQLEGLLVRHCQGRVDVLPVSLTARSRREVAKGWLPTTHALAARAHRGRHPGRRGDRA